MFNPFAKLAAWENRVNSLYEQQGYLLDTQTGLYPWLARLVFWASSKSPDGDGFKKMSTVVNGKNHVICYHKSANLLGHGDYPGARVENRYTMNEKFFRHKIWGEDA